MTRLWRWRPRRWGFAMGTADTVRAQLRAQEAVLAALTGEGAFR